MPNIGTHRGERAAGTQPPREAPLAPAPPPPAPPPRPAAPRHTGTGRGLWHGRGEHLLLTAAARPHLLGLRREPGPHRARGHPPSARIRRRPVPAGAAR